MPTPNNNAQEWAAKELERLNQIAILNVSPLWEEWFRGWEKKAFDIFKEALTLSRKEARQEAIEECKRCVDHLSPESKYFDQHYGFKLCKDMSLSALDKLANKEQQV